MVLNLDPYTRGLRIYLVGGAVRDALLGCPSSDRDWVVVGTSPEAMAAAGFRAVESQLAASNDVNHLRGFSMHKYLSNSTQ